MRVTGGTGRGKRLRVPAGDRVRPTSDKVKQALFNILGSAVEGASFLDLFAGTGAIGIEALSRGAARVVFVDDARRSLDAIRRNLIQAGPGGHARVVASRAEAYIRKGAEQFTLVFLDPPYTTEIKPLLELIAGSALLRPDTVIVAEHFKKQPSPERAGTLVRYRQAVYGDTVLAFYRGDAGGGAGGQEGTP
jgi:16S rRNA (guanine966-N2)-methyltransferase